jgi:predicted DNA-binding transcriptional regulator AlpA
MRADVGNKKAVLFSKESQPMSETESEWLGGARTAAYLGVTAMTIWRWERDPKLAFPTASVIHGRKYWNPNDIDVWMRRMATCKATATEKVGGGSR